MAYEINITGEIVPFDGYEGFYSSIELERELVKANGDDLIVNINSVGGDVDEGFIIYIALRKYAASNNAKITTYAKGRCYSIATIIFLSGDKRIANRYLSPFIHNAWFYTVGDANQLLKDAADLEAVNKKIGLFYAEHTELTYDEAREWMDADTYIDPDECVRIRFATEVEEIVRPAALVQSITRQIHNKNNNKNMNKNKSEKNFFNAMKNFFNSNAENSIELSTADSQTLVFPDLEDGQEPGLGDKAEIDGKSAEGEILMADGRTFVFENGNLTEIKEKETSTEETTTMEELQAENKSLKEQLASQNKVVENQGKEISEIKKTVTALNKKFEGFGALISEYGTDDKDLENPDRQKDNNNDGGAFNTKNLKELVRKNNSK